MKYAWKQGNCQIYFEDCEKNSVFKLKLGVNNFVLATQAEELSNFLGFILFWKNETVYKTKISLHNLDRQDFLLIWLLCQRAFAYPVICIMSITYYYKFICEWWFEFILLIIR